MKRIKKYYRILLAVFTVVVLYITFFVSVNPTSKNGADVGKNTNINISDDQEKTEEQPGEQIVSYFFDENDKEASVFSGLLNYGQENNIKVEYNNDYSEYGVFVESIAGVKNGDDGKYWQYYVNDVLGDVAADNKILKEGDSVEWRFEEVPF